ncbi:MAG: ECF transporter S component, partial [Microbacteriaceae bacterium]|nr:ECF transporter S component [Microbacteriaceae bacterium]
MRWRPGPVLVALATAAVFVVARVCYAAVFGGLSAGEPVLLDLPRLRGAGVFAHVAFLGPVTGSAIVRTLLGALPFAAVIVGCGLLASLLDVRRGLARLAGHGPVRNLGRALVVAWDTVPSLVGAVRDSALAARLLGRRPGPRALVPVLEHAIEHAVALGASMEVRGLGARSRSEAVACERPVVAHGVVLSRGDWAMRVPELSLPAGSLVLVTGGTGSGKSTLLNAMSGLF